jgi:hypothetical protein
MQPVCDLTLQTQCQFKEMANSECIWDTRKQGKSVLGPVLGDNLKLKLKLTRVLMCRALGWSADDVGFLNTASATPDLVASGFLPCLHAKTTWEVSKNFDTWASLP